MHGLGMTCRGILPSRLLAFFQISHSLGSLWDPSPRDAGFSVFPPPPKFTISNYSSTHARPKDMYYVAFPKDFLKSKVLVYGVDALEIPQTIIFARRVMGTLRLITIFGSCGSVFP